MRSFFLISSVLLLTVTACFNSTDRTPSSELGETFELRVSENPKYRITNDNSNFNICIEVVNTKSESEKIVVEPGSSFNVPSNINFVRISTENNEKSSYLTYRVFELRDSTNIFYDTDSKSWSLGTPIYGTVPTDKPVTYRAHKVYSTSVVELDSNLDEFPCNQSN